MGPPVFHDQWDQAALTNIKIGPVGESGCVSNM
jgi:hypothetical protein